MWSIWHIIAHSLICLLRQARNVVHPVRMQTSKQQMEKIETQRARGRKNVGSILLPPSEQNMECVPSARFARWTSLLGIHKIRWVCTWLKIERKAIHPPIEQKLAEPRQVAACSIRYTTVRTIKYMISDMLRCTSCVCIDFAIIDCRNYRAGVRLDDMFNSTFPCAQKRIHSNACPT